MSIKRILFIFFALVSCMGLGFVIYQKISHIMIKNRHSSLYSLYQEKLTEHERQIWKNITQKTGLTQKKAQEKQRIINEHKKKRIPYNTIDSSISLETRDLIQQTLLEFDIDPTTIQIMSYDNKSSALSADDFIIYVYEPVFNILSLDAKKFVIAHEIQHILNMDTSMDGALRTLLGRGRRTYAQSEIYALSRFIELRADIGALLHDPECLKGGITFFSTLLQDEGDSTGLTHPRFSERLGIAQNMEARLFNQPYTPVAIG